MDELNTGVLWIVVSHSYGRAVRRDGPVSEHGWLPGHAPYFLLHALKWVERKEHELLLSIRLSHHARTHGGSRTVKLVDGAGGVEPPGLPAVGWNAEYASGMAWRT